MIDLFRKTWTVAAQLRQNHAISLSHEGKLQAGVVGIGRIVSVKSFIAG